MKLTIQKLPNFLKKITEYLTLSLVGGVLYVLIEISFRGYSHPSMFLAGAICLILVGLINKVLPWDTPMLLQMFIGGTLITAVELIFGIVFNLILHLDVWDYSELHLNFKGQICLQFSLLWCVLSAIGIVLDDWLRYLWFGEEKPHYKLF